MFKYDNANCFICNKLMDNNVSPDFSSHTQISAEDRKAAYRNIDTNRIKSEPIDFCPLILPHQLLCTLKPHQVMGVKRMLDVSGFLISFLYTV